MDTPISQNQNQPWSTLTPGNTASEVTKRPAVIYSIDVFNSNAAARHLKIYDTASSASATAANTPRYRTGLPPGNKTITFPEGMKFNAGVFIRVVTEMADAGTTDPTPGETSVSIVLKSSGG